MGQGSWQVLSWILEPAAVWDHFLQHHSVLVRQLSPWRGHCQDVQRAQGRSGVGAGTDVGAEALSPMWEFSASLSLLTSASLCPGLSCQNGG